jgi:hypothetical protein
LFIDYFIFFRSIKMTKNPREGLLTGNSFITLLYDIKLKSQANEDNVVHPVFSGCFSWADNLYVGVSAGKLN